MKWFSLLFVLFLLSITLFGAFFVETNSADAAMRPRIFRRFVGGSCSNGSCSNGSCSRQSTVTKSRQNCPGGTCTKDSSTNLEVDVIIIPDVVNQDNVKETCCDCKCGCPNCKCATEDCKNNNGKCNCTCGCKSCKCCNENVKKDCTNGTCGPYSDCSNSSSSSVYRSRTVIRNNNNNSMGKGRIRAFIKKILHR